MLDDLRLPGLGRCHGPHRLDGVDALVEVVRSGSVESRHRGVAVLVEPTGHVSWSLGDPATVIFPRSTNKPFQAVGMVRAGLGLADAQLALAASSHAGEPFQVAGVREILTQAGLAESALQTPAAYPADREARAALLRTDQPRAPIFMDCSGKHAAMLLTSVLAGWPTSTYLNPEHPVQQMIADTYAELVARPELISIDGCGAPLFSASLVDLAAGISGLMSAADGTAEHAVAKAMVDFPEQVSGTNRPELALAKAVPGALVKSGAEGVLVVGLADGRTLALKIEDGSERGLFVAATRALQLAGVQAELFSDFPPVLGGVREVGSIRPAF